MRSPAAILVDSAGNIVGVLNDTGTFRLQTSAKLAAGTETVGKVIITDGTNDAAVSVDGRLQVINPPPEAPPGTTAVSDEEVGTISSANFQNYSIPVGETLVIQRFLAGCAGEGGKGALVELRYDQGGGEPIQDLEIARLYVQASSDFIDLNFTAPRPAQSGDRIRIRRFPLEGSTQEIYGRWEGYY